MKRIYFALAALFTLGVTAEYLSAQGGGFPSFPSFQGVGIGVPAPAITGMYIGASAGNNALIEFAGNGGSPSSGTASLAVGQDATGASVLQNRVNNQDLKLNTTGTGKIVLNTGITTGQPVLINGLAGAGSAVIGFDNTSTLRFNVGTVTTVGGAGGASALPATPLGYMVLQINAVNVKIPYYSP
jgi:hypothetical protein